jgi:amino acid transporter
MVGGNPKHDAYGFRYWNSPGAFAEYRTTGSLGRFEGFLAALWSASFCVVGPEYISVVAAEAKRPRTYIKNAFKTMYIRFGIFFMGGSLAVGIVCAYNDPTLVAILTGDRGGSGTAAASPYVIAMSNLGKRQMHECFIDHTDSGIGIDVLPHLVNALMITSIFSAGNTYCYCAIRNLYGLALEGRAPRFLLKCTKGGVPIYCFLVVMCFPALSFLQVSNGSNTVLTWLVNLITAGGIINYIVMTVTYLCFYRACKAQSFDRKLLPYTGWFQPFSGFIGLGWMIFIVFTYGYSVFKPWSVEGFFTNYTMVILAPLLYIAWKVIHKTKIVKPTEVDLIWEAPIIDAYEATFYNKPLGFWTEILQMFGLMRHVGGDERKLTQLEAESRERNTTSIETKTKL